MKFIDLEKLKPHEKVLPKHIQKLLKEIQKDKAIYTPVLIDKKSKVILDGHHRVFIARLLKMQKIPCIEVNYFNDAEVSVLPRRKNILITKEDVIQAGLKGKLFPHKTTKHILLTPAK